MTIFSMKLGIDKHDNIFIERKPILTYYIYEDFMAPIHKTAETNFY